MTRSRTSVPRDPSIELRRGQDGKAVLVAAGELDLVTERLLDSVLEQAQRHTSDISIDLGHVTFIDVRTVNVLERRARACALARGRLRLRNGKGQPRKLLQLCGLGALLE